MPDGEIADADRARFAPFAEQFQRVPALNASPHGIMNQIKIHVIHFEPMQACLQRSLRVSVIGIPQFCRDEDLLTGNTALAYCGAHALFVAVHRCRIDVAVARFECCEDRCLAGRPGPSLPHAQSELRNQPPVVQGNFAFDRQGWLHRNDSTKALRYRGAAPMRRVHSTRLVSSWLINFFVVSSLRFPAESNRSAALPIITSG